MCRWPAELGVRRLTCRAGDAILFTEALAHTTIPFINTERERRTVFFKYVPYGALSHLSQRLV